MLIILAIIIFAYLFHHRIGKAVYALEQYELHHKLITFLGVILFTILFVRIGANIYDPNPFFFGFSIHHFDYGIFMLITLMILMVLDNKKKHYPLYALLSAVSLGLVIDQLYLIRRMEVVTDSPIVIYNSTSTSVIVLFIFIFLVSIIINHKKIKI